MHFLSLAENQLSFLISEIFGVKKINSLVVYVCVCVCVCILVFTHQTRVRLVTEAEYPLKDSIARCSMPVHNQTTEVIVSSYTCER